LLILVIIGKMLDMTGSFPAAFVAFEARGLHP
jgi:hypothetical protein